MSDADRWKTYPFELVDTDGQFTFPEAEGTHDDCESDTWFIAGELAGESGGNYAFLTIFNKNRPGGSVVADFYSSSVFDLDSGQYGTYTAYDMPPKNMVDGHVPHLTAVPGSLDLTFDSDAGTARWDTRRDDAGELVPYTYSVSLPGRDQQGTTFSIDLEVEPTRAPVPLGADEYNGDFACFGQEHTYSYFQTGMVMSGTLRWGDREESVSGIAGHVDRQWFPLYAGGGGADGDPRGRSHEWRTIHLDSGLDLSIWRQFDRTRRNRVTAFTGITTSSPDPDVAPRCVEDLEVETYSYVKWPNVIRPLVRPPSKANYMPDRHRVVSEALELDLVGEPVVAAPAHGLPIEYMEGPYRYTGTHRGEPVTGFAIFERSLAYYRDWELVDVLTARVDELLDRPHPLHRMVIELHAWVAAGGHREVLDFVETALEPAVAELDDDVRGPIGEIVTDFAASARLALEQA